MSRHNMRDMDSASKLLMAHEKMAMDTIDFILRKSGYAVVEGSMQRRPAEAIAKIPGLKRLYKKVCNDVVWELEIAAADGPPVRLLAAFENQSYPSLVMPFRGLMSVTVRMAAWRQETEDMHNERQELHSRQEVMDGVLPDDKMTPFIPMTVYFGNDAWTGPTNLPGMTTLPEKLHGYFANCPCNLLSFRDLTEQELSEMRPGPLRAVAKCIRYADDPIRLAHEMETDPSFQSLPSAVYGVVKIATGMDWLRPNRKEGNNMQKKMSTFERHFRAEGEAKGIAIGEAKGKTEGIAIGEAKGKIEGIENTIRSFIERKRSRHVSEEDIFEELRLDFGLDIQSARRYMEPSWTNV